MNTYAQRTLASFLMVSACAAAIGVMAQGTDLSFEQAKTVYGFTNWVGKAKSTYKRLVQNWEPDITSAGFTHVSKRIKRTEKEYICIIESEAFGLTKLRVVECDGIRGAHDTLIGVLSNLSVPTPLPEGRAVGLEIGDKCFVGYPTNTPCQVLFTRNNMFVWVSNEHPNTNIFELVRELDAQIKARSEQ